MTPERFAKGMTFDDYVKFTGSPANLGREGFDIRRFSLVRPRVDWSGFLRERHAKARLTDEQTAAIKWLAAQPGGPKKILVLSEDWSSDCRRDGGGVEGARRPRHCRAARLALRGCVGRRRNRRDPQRAPRAATVELRYGDVMSWSGSTA